MIYSSSKGHARNGVFRPFEKDETGKYLSPSENTVRLPENNQWQGYNRVPPQTGIVPAVLTSQEVDFQYGGGMARGYLDEMFIEITLTEGNVSNAIFNPYNLWNHIDIVNQEGQIFKQIFPDEMFFGNMLWRDLLEHQRFHNVEGLQLNYTPNSPTIAQNTSQTFILKMPVFKDKLVDLRHLKSPLWFRFYFNPITAISQSSSSNSVALASMYLLYKEVLLPSSHLRHCMSYRYLSWVRNVQQLAMAPSTEYDIQLNTFSKCAKSMFFVIRPTGTSTSGDAWANYAPGSFLATFELRDAGNNIVGVNNSVNESKYIFSEDSNSDFLIQANTYVFVLNFGMDGLGDQGGSTYAGGYNFTTRELLHLRTNSSLTAGTYEVTIWALNHEFFEVNPMSGEFKFTK